MSRARKGIRPQQRRVKRRKVNPMRQQAITQPVEDGVFYDPESAEGRAAAAMMEAIFGPAKGRVVAVAASDNVRL